MIWGPDEGLRGQTDRTWGSGGNLSASGSVTVLLSFTTENEKAFVAWEKVHDMSKPRPCLVMTLNSNNFNLSYATSSKLKGLLGRYWESCWLSSIVPWSIYKFRQKCICKNNKKQKRSQHDQYIENSQFVWGSRSYQLCQNLRLSPWWPISSLHLWKHKSRPHSISVPFKSKLGQTNLEAVHLHNPTVKNSLMSSVYLSISGSPCLHFTVRSTLLGVL